MTIKEVRKLVESRITIASDRDDIDLWRADCQEEIQYVFDVEASTKKEAVAKVIDSILSIPKELLLFELEEA